MPAAETKQMYSRTEVLRVLGVTSRQLRGWEKLGLIAPADNYGFSEMVALRTLARLREAKVPSAKIHRALAAVRRKLTGIKDPLTELKIYSDGSRIRVQIGDQRMEPESGQLLLDFEEAELRRLVPLPSREHHERRAAERRRQADAENWFQRGIEFEQTGAPVQQAINAYEVAIALDPNLAAALVNLGTIYFTARDWENARRYYTKALEVNPTYPLAHFNMGNLHDERGDRPRALFHYQQAIKLDPHYADAHYNLALLYQGSGQVMKAVRYWRAYLRLDPGSAWAEIARRELDKLYAETVVQGKAQAVL